ncbi:hypothetical protein [Bdellovibrio svalbardensis]|uniref:Uncharacterized protein n=1 Tax=Bdellovibrio svalbardensis TaxID=2972972 RepID=A0ABT6DJS4_9BACT|nr:hypothetical protein [Bdellovibrio svalbardensis]MDG0816470.1 hypothetical protein [Bdellovibrio svalbardensis]
MKTIGIIVIFFFNISLAAAAITGEFTVQQMPGCTHQLNASAPMAEDFTYTGVSIQTNVPNSIHITLNPNSSPFKPQIYICDSQEHKGDGVNTGDTYLASCSDDSIHIRRVFHQLKYSLIANYRQTSLGLTYTETFDGDQFTRTCEFISVH